MTTVRGTWRIGKQWKEQSGEIVHDGGKMNITLKQLRAFCAVYELQSFTQAAKVLHLTQSAVSKLCAELEAEFRLPLFERTTRRVEPCDSAGLLYAHATEVLGSLRTAERSLSNLVALESGAISIAASPMMMVGLIGNMLADFHRKYPNVKLNLLELSSDQTVEAVLNGHADMGLVSADIQEKRLGAQVIYSDLMYVACPVGHELLGKKRLQWPDLVKYPHVALHDVYSVRRTVDRILAEHKLASPAHIQTGLLTSALFLVKQGLGITIVPGYVCEFVAQLGLVTKRIYSPTEYHHPISLILRKPVRHSIAAQAFQERMLAYLRKRQAKQ